MSGLMRGDAREIFAHGLEAVDARRAVLEAVRVEGARLRVCDAVFDLDETRGHVYSIALGKAGTAMASALDERLGARLAGGVVSAPAAALSLSERWRSYAGGHPLPNDESFASARAAFDLLRRADEEKALVIFLVSGGGSAMMELPRDERITLEEMREVNRTLVSSGASISEINAVRRSLSRVKGGGLSSMVTRAAQLTLIISDTNAGRERDVASGPTLEPDLDAPDPREVIAQYNLASQLPSSVLRAIEENDKDDEDERRRRRSCESRRERFVLLDNSSACEAAARAARRLGYATEIALDIVEQHVSDGAAELVSRLLNDKRLGERSGGVCLISGGEFACPVRGGGTGGRNSETALRCAFEFALRTKGEAARLDLVALSAGTDGIDGNSSAAGALADHTTLERAAARGLSPERHLDDSDAFTLFDALGDTIITGPTETNVRDLRILMARKLTR